MNLKHFVWFCVRFLTKLKVSTSERERGGLRKGKEELTTTEDKVDLISNCFFFSSINSLILLLLLPFFGVADRSYLSFHPISINLC